MSSYTNTCTASSTCFLICLAGFFSFSLIFFVPFFRLWPLSILVPLTIYGIIVRLTPNLRDSIGWMHRGKIGPNVTILIIATVFVSSFALLGWAIITKPNIDHHLALIPKLPIWVFPIIGIRGKRELIGCSIILDYWE